MGLILAGLLLVIVIVLWVLTLVGLPGNWCIVAVVVPYAFLISNDSRLDISWWTWGSLVCLAALGEIIEFAAGALGVKKAGGSRRGMTLTVAGSVLGGSLGLIVGLPIPLVGPLLGAVLFASLGAAAGAVLGERWQGQDGKHSLRVGRAAFWGRLLGTFGKAAAGVVMILVVLGALLA